MCAQFKIKSLKFPIQHLIFVYGCLWSISNLPWLSSVFLTLHLYVCLQVFFDSAVLGVLRVAGLAPLGLRFGVRCFAALSGWNSRTNFTKLMVTALGRSVLRTPSHRKVAGKIDRIFLWTVLFPSLENTNPTMSDPHNESDCGELEFEFEDDEGNNSPAYVSSDREVSEQPSPCANSPKQPSGTQIKVYSRDELLTLLQSTVDECCDILGLPVHVVEVLLRSCKWKSDVLIMDWTDAESRVLDKAGFPPDYRQHISDLNTASPSSENAMFFCPILFDDFPFQETSALACGHRFSNSCWEQYLISNLSNGESSLFARCVGYKCPEVVPMSYWQRFLSAGDFQKLIKYRLNSYVEASRDLCFCPGPDCTYTMQLLGANGDVKCVCGYQFCFFCADEPHRPVPCEFIRRWHEKNVSEADNVTWILINTKSCPGCKQPIEKERGCMHMTCRCGTEFCWLCRGLWKEHTSSSYYNCNVYKDKPKAGNHQTDELKLRAKELERYAHYYERYRAHNSAERLARGPQLDRIKLLMELIHDSAGHIIDIAFFEEAVRQIADCRRFLKWTYAYSYFAKWKGERALDLFQYHQGELERSLDLLHETTENFEVDKYIGDEAESFKPLFEFKTNLVNLTRVVKKYFNAMCEAFETEFIDVNNNIC